MCAIWDMWTSIFDDDLLELKEKLPKLEKIILLLCVFSDDDTTNIKVQNPGGMRCWLYNIATLFDKF